MDYLSAAEKVLRLLIISCFIIVRCKVKGEYSTSVSPIPLPLTYPVPEQIETNGEHGRTRTQIGDVEIIEYKNGPIMQRQEEEEVGENDGDVEGEGEGEGKGEVISVNDDIDDLINTLDAAQMPEAEVAEETASAEGEPSVQPPVSTVTTQPEGVGAEETLQNDAPAIEAEAAVHQTPPETEKPQNNNTNFKIPDSCYTCDNGPNCTWYVAEKINCKAEAEAEFSETEKTHSGCYTMFDVSSNGTFRGCVEELTQSGLKYCLTHPLYCKVCFTNNCNNFITPNTTANRHINEMLLAMVIGFIIIKSININNWLPF